MTESTAVQAEDRGEPHIQLTVSPDAMEVLLTCNLEALEAPDFYDRVFDELTRMHVALIPERVDFVARIAKHKKEGATFLEAESVSRGRQPILPVDARTDWSKDYFNTQYVVDPDTGQIDFKRRVGDPSVKEGELLALFHPPQPGTPGHDVFGDPIPVAKATGRRPLPGRNVEWNEETKEFRAKKDGRVSREGRTIHVDNVYEVRSAVGGGTGSIHHNGTVLVHGDIQDHYVLSATEDVEVRGTIYEAEITCGRNLAAMGGISSNNNGTICVNGTCQSRYAIQTSLECQGSVAVENEIYQSEVRTPMDVSCPKGRIVGGTVAAGRGIVVGEAGSKSNTQTYLVIEADPNTKAAIAACKKAIDAAREPLPALQDRLRTLQRQLASFGPAGEAAIAKTEQEIAGYERIIAEQTEEMNARVRAQRADRSARVLVRERAFPGVIFRILGQEKRLDIELEGPFVARLDWDKMEIILTSGLE